MDFSQLQILGERKRSVLKEDTKKRQRYVGRGAYWGDLGWAMI